MISNSLLEQAENIKFTLEQQMVFFARLVGRFNVADEITPIKIDNFDWSITETFGSSISVMVWIFGVTWRFSSFQEACDLSEPKMQLDIYQVLYVELYLPIRWNYMFSMPL